MPEPRPTHEDLAYDRLRTAILSLALAPGEPLSERGLESLTGSSRTPTRAALMRLSNEGLVLRAGRGWQVSPLDLAEIRDVSEYREALESAAVALAVSRAADDELPALRTLAASDSDADDEESGLRSGSDFHVALARLSGNAFLADGIAGALTRLARTRWLEVRTPESRGQARDEHLAIVHAVQARDADLAVSLVLAHSRGTTDRVLTYLTGERQRLRGRGVSIVETSESPSAV